MLGLQEKEKKHSPENSLHAEAYQNDQTRDVKSTLV